MSRLSELTIRGMPLLQWIALLAAGSAMFLTPEEEMILALYERIQELEAELVRLGGSL